MQPSGTSPVPSRRALPAWSRIREKLPAAFFAIALLALMGAALVASFRLPALSTALIAASWATGALLMVTRRSLLLPALGGFLLAIGWAFTHWLITQGHSTFVNIDDPWQMAGYLLLLWHAGRVPQRMRLQTSWLLLAIFGLFCVAALGIGSLIQHRIPWNIGTTIVLCLLILARAAPAIETALHGLSPDGRLLWVCGLLVYTGGHVILGARELGFAGLSRHAPDAALVIGSLLVPFGLYAEDRHLPLGFWSFVICVAALLATWAAGVLLLIELRTMLLLWCLFQGILFMLAIIGFSMWFSGRAPRVLESALDRLADVEQQRRAKADFLANLSHELRTPLNAILGFSDLLSTDSTLDESIRRHAAAIRSTGERLLALINDILDLSKLRAGKMPAEPVVLDPAPLFKEAMQAILPAAQARGVGLQLQQADMPQRMTSDKIRLDQLLRTVLHVVLAQARRGQKLHLTIETAAGTLAWSCSLDRAGRTPRHESNPSVALRLMLAQALTELLGGRLEQDKPWQLHISLPLRPLPPPPPPPPLPPPPPDLLRNINHKAQLAAASLGIVIPVLLAVAHNLTLVQGVMTAALLLAARALHRERSWRLAAYGLGSIAAFQLIWLPVSLRLMTPEGLLWQWISRLDDMLWLGGLMLLLVALARLPQRRPPWRGLAAWSVIGLFSLPMLQGIHSNPVLSYDLAYTIADLLLLAVSLPQLEAALVAQASSGRLLWGFGLLMEWLGHTLDGLIPSSMLALHILWAMSMLTVAAGLLIEAKKLPYGETALLSCVGGLFVAISFGLLELSLLHVPLTNWLLVGTATLALGALASLSPPQSKLARALGQLDGIYRQRQMLEADQARFSNHMTAAMNRHIDSILYHGRVLLRTAAPDEREGYVEPIVQATEHLQGLLDDVADFTSGIGMTGTEKLEPTTLDMAAVLQSTTALVKQLATKKNIRLHHEVNKHLPPVLADQRKLKQMLYNYLSNAIKFTPEQGHITISAQPISRASVLALFQGSPGFSDGSLVKTTVFVQVCVTDSGQGIAAADQQRLFGHYEQVQQSQRDKGVTKAVAGLGGTGLGLMMVKTLATAHGGAVAVTSAPGEGSRFYFFLPLHAIGSAGSVAAATPFSGEAMP